MGEADAPAVDLDHACSDRFVQQVADAVGRRRQGFEQLNFRVGDQRSGLQVRKHSLRQPSEPLSSQ